MLFDHKVQKYTSHILKINHLWAISTQPSLQKLLQKEEVQTIQPAFSSHKASHIAQQLMCIRPVLLLPLEKSC